MNIAHEWNGHLEILNLPRGIENSRLFLFLRTDILQKLSLGAPERDGPHLVPILSPLRIVKLKFFPFTDIKST